MGLDDHATNRQPNASPGRLGRKKWLKNMIAAVTFNSSAGVFDGDDDFGKSRNEESADTQVTGTAGHGTHGFNRVRNQIQEYLLQLASIAEQLREAVAQVGYD